MGLHVLHFFMFKSDKHVVVVDRCSSGTGMSFWLLASNF